MIRTSILAAFIALAAPAAAAAQTLAALEPTHPVLKRQAFVSSDIVRIGDLIDNAGIVADVPIFRAPDLGQTGSVPAARVAEAVRAHAIVGLDTGGNYEVVVTRLSHALPAKDIELRIAQAIATQYRVGAPEDLLVTFDRDVRTVHIDPAVSEPRVSRLAYDTRSGRFDIVLDGNGRPLRFTGSAVPSVETVILTRPIDRGAVLKSADIVIERRPKAQVGKDALTSADLALGHSARRGMSAGQVLSKGDVQKPDMVTRDTDVTLTFEVPGILLTTRGKALDSGGEGDVINVLNVQSKRTVQGVIVGPGRVVVGNTAPRVTANLDPSSDTSNAPRERAE